MSSILPNIDFDRLLKLRLVVARFGEMDGAQWWNTKGLLGRNGALLMSRGFAKTHRFAQARLAFAVAAARSREVFDPPESMTLWKLPAAVEDQFDARWHHWLSERAKWAPFFEQLQQLPGDTLLEALAALQLVDEATAHDAQQLRRSAEGRAVPVPGVHSPSDAVLTLLAAAFHKGEPGSPAIPYARIDG